MIQFFDRKAASAAITFSQTGAQILRLLVKLSGIKSPATGSPRDRPVAVHFTRCNLPRLHGIEPDETDVTLPLGERVGHTLVLGTTRVGKTRLAEWLVTQDIRSPANTRYASSSTLKAMPNCSGAYPGKSIVQIEAKPNEKNTPRHMAGREKHVAAIELYLNPSCRPSSCRRSMPRRHRTMSTGTATERSGQLNHPAVSFHGRARGALFLCILIECMGMHLFWPEQGCRHARQRLSYELDPLPRHFTRSVLVPEPGVRCSRSLSWLMTSCLCSRVCLSRLRTRRGKLAESIFQPSKTFASM